VRELKRFIIPSVAIEGMVTISGIDIFILLFGILILVIVLDFIHMHKQVGEQYPLIRRATYIGVAGIGVIIILAIPLNPTLDQAITDKITIAALGIALGTVGYTIVMQLDSDYNQNQFQNSIKNDLQQIKKNLGIAEGTISSIDEEIDPIQHTPLKELKSVPYLSPIFIVLILAGYSYLGGDLVLCSGLLGAAFILIIKPFL
jgi:hypothetical protein